MRLLLLASLGLLLVSSGCSGGTAPHSGSFNPGTAPANRYIVGLAPGASVTSVSAANAVVPDQVYSRVLNGFAGPMSAGQVAALRANPQVRFVEPDLVAVATPPGGGGGGKPGGKPGDGGGGGGGGGDDTIPWGVDRINANDNTGPKGAGVAVAIFDTGVDLDHPDLAAGILGSYDATGGNSADDKNGHGTHVAGIVGARDNGFGYVGVAPECGIVAVKVLGNSGSGYISWIVSGIEWAVANRTAFSAPIRVGNMSLSAYGYSQALADAITTATDAGICFAVAAGNSQANAANYTPAGLGNVVCVSALDPNNPNNNFASYSNYGSAVDLIAPGTNVPSCWKGGGYKTISGTSMAAPHVAGALALWADNNSGGFAAASSALQFAGDLSWNTATDPDNTHEKLVIASGL